MLCLLFANNAIGLSFAKADTAPAPAAELSQLKLGNANGDPVPVPAKEPSEKCDGDDSPWLRMARPVSTDTQISFRTCKHHLTESASPQFESVACAQSTDNASRAHLRVIAFREFFATTMCMRT